METIKHISKNYKYMYVFSIIYLILAYTYHPINKLVVSIFTVTVIINVLFILEYSSSKNIKLLLNTQFFVFLILLIFSIMFYLILKFYNSKIFFTIIILLLSSIFIIIMLAKSRLIYNDNYYNILKNKEEILVLLNFLKKFNESTGQNIQKNKFKYTDVDNKKLYLLSELLEEIYKTYTNDNLNKILSNNSNKLTKEIVKMYNEKGKKYDIEKARKLADKIIKKRYYNFRILEIYNIALFELI
ncbi:hypothetical protein HZY83_02055, partial [Gemella sp. GH3]|uniref:hypothetical protein n=1 Tax=unclassified Gemella TaxID=2624949 RepID=UPI0015CFDCEA